jgi:hypothetical protein
MQFQETQTPAHEEILSAATATLSVQPNIMAEPQIATTLTSTTQNPAPSNGGGLHGSPPEVFNGDRTKAKEFLRAFKRWWKLNHDKAVFDSPYK